MKNSSPEQRKGATYMSGQTAQEVQNGRVRIRESRSGSKEATTVTTTADTQPHADRRRTVIVAVLGVLALLVTLALVAVGSSRTGSEVTPATGTYTGDWKDALTERSGPQPYTGDWKDGLTEQNGSQPYTGDWKDGLTEQKGSQPYTGDWKDLLSERGR